MEDPMDDVQQINEEPMQSEIIVSKGILRFLAILGIFAFILGFFIVLSIIVISIPFTTLLFPHGFVVGLLLLFGGIFLLLSLIILNQESKRSIITVTSHTDQNEL